jgi:hypothetical protein
MMYQGIRNEIPGMSLATSIKIESLFCPNLAIEYAAGSPIKSDNNTAPNPTMLEFIKYSKKFCSPKTFW